MPPGLVFGLSAALAWGVVDVAAAISGRRIGSMRAVVVTQLASLVGLALFTLARPDLLGPNALDGLRAGLPLGLISSVAYVLYFAALRIGPLSVVSPIIVSYGGITVILALLIRGESMHLLQAGGALLATMGVILTGLVFHGGTLRGARLVGPGVVAAIITALVFASVSIMLTTPIRDFGWLAVVAGSRIGNTAASLCVFAVAVRSGGGPLAPLLVRTASMTRRIVLLLVIAGFCDVGGFLIYAMGLEVGPVWLVGLASSFGPVFVIAYGVGSLGERLARTQWMGLALLAAGIGLLAVAG